MRGKLSSKSGLTLIETLVYLALFAILFGVFTEYFFTTSESNKAALDKNEIDRAVLQIDSHMSESFYKVSSINEAGSVFNNNSGRLVIGVSGVTIEYYISNGRLMVNRNGVVNPITSEEYQVDTFLVERILTTLNSLEGVRISIGISSTNGDYEGSSVTNYLL